MDSVEFRMENDDVDGKVDGGDRLSTGRIVRWKKVGGGGWGKVFVVSERRSGDPVVCLQSRVALAPFPLIRKSARKAARHKP